MSLPTRLKIDVRDQWAKEDCDLQIRFQEIYKVVGFRVDCSPDWPLLWTELKAFFPDPSAFIPYVRSIVVMWSRLLCDLLQDDKNEVWVEQVLDGVSKTSSVKIRLGIGRAELPATTWANLGFQILLPRAAPRPLSESSGGINVGLLACFEPPQGALDNTITAGQVPDDSWADVGAEMVTGQSSTPVAQTKASAGTPPVHVKLLPDVDSLQRPEDLMLKPPYQLAIRSKTAFSTITIECSHPPTLKVIEGYLKKWTKREFNNINQPPAARLTLSESPFGLGTSYSVLEIEIEQYSRYILTPTFFVSFVQNALGYSMTYEDGIYWAFRRDAEFRTG
ncbi:hypothetical protein BCR34DRAFT_595605 [Clohesyomyces aquaticus]|uniref:Uncharacterized protein n=1 Tax=Clohesyomyces aquaticus TaxID=1231657 RepID=A0A1Y2A9F9_9PLEO|nr:hypothetical protein BCR34DRAFT_595605 [Clohesyomyces aquaticus]